MNILGIDYGRKKIGLAIGNSETALIEPLVSIVNEPASVLFSALAQLVRKNNIDLIVIGLPEGKLASEVKDFGLLLEKKFNLPVKFADETLTTLDAQKILGKIRRNRNYKAKMEDATAAAIMLESYLESGGEHV